MAQTPPEILVSDDQLSNIEESRESLDEGWKYVHEPELLQEWHDMGKKELVTI